jgi:hypothetical protein
VSADRIQICARFTRIWITDIKIIWNSEEITNPENAAELLNLYFAKF